MKSVGLESDYEHYARSDQDPIVQIEVAPVMGPDSSLVEVVRLSLRQKGESTVVSVASVVVTPGGSGEWARRLFNLTSARESPAARKRSASWFDDNRKRLAKRSATLAANDIDIWEAAIAKAGVQATRADLSSILPTFKLLFDSKDQLVLSTATRYAQRLAQIPASVIEEWMVRTGGVGVGLKNERVIAALSLIAEDGVFPANQFSESAFRMFATSFK